MLTQPCSVHCGFYPIRSGRRHRVSSFTLGQISAYLCDLHRRLCRRDHHCLMDHVVNSGSVVFSGTRHLFHLNLIHGWKRFVDLYTAFKKFDPAPKFGDFFAILRIVFGQKIFDLKTSKSYQIEVTPWHTYDIQMSRKSLFQLDTIYFDFGAFSWVRFKKTSNCHVTDLHVSNFTCTKVSSV